MRALGLIRFAFLQIQRKSHALGKGPDDTVLAVQLSFVGSVDKRYLYSQHRILERGGLRFNICRSLVGAVKSRCVFSFSRLVDMKDDS